MEKVIAYSLAEKRDLKNLETGNKLFFARVQARGVMDINEISERIHRECTVTRADIVAVLTALGTVVTDGLKQGELVRLGDLGTLQIGLSSEGTKEAKDFTPANIKKARILFRSGKDLADAVSNLSFKQVPKIERHTAQKQHAINPVTE